MMTEEEWVECDDPKPMLEIQSGATLERKVILYLCAGVRSLWMSLYDRRSRDAIAVLERAVDGLASPQDYRDAWYFAESPTFGYDFAPFFIREYRDDESEAESVRRLLDMGVYTEEDIASAVDENEFIGNVRVRDRLQNLAHVVYHAFHCITREGCVDEHLIDHLSRQDGWPRGSLVREIFGNPFRPKPLDLSRITPTVETLAQAAYDDRTVPSGELYKDRLAVLSDALEDAGCTDADILTHLRSPSPHVRGCWALDLLLGKS